MNNVHYRVAESNCRFHLKAINSRGENIVRYFIHIGLERLRACLGLCWGIKLLKSKRVFYKKLNFKFFSKVCLGPFLE
jgi:hypothetical protein